MQIMLTLPDITMMIWHQGKCSHPALKLNPTDKIDFKHTCVKHTHTHTHTHTYTQYCSTKYGKSLSMKFLSVNSN
jgi:hypothetical protein